jgi:hypothetical protein
MYIKKQSSPATRHGGAWGERRYSFYSFSVTPRPRFAPGNGPPVPIVHGAGWAPEPVWTQKLEEKSSAPAGDQTMYIKAFALKNAHTYIWLGMERGATLHQVRTFTCPAHAAGRSLPSEHPSSTTPPNRFGWHSVCGVYSQRRCHIRCIITCIGPL